MGGIPVLNESPFRTVEVNAWLVCVGEREEEELETAKCADYSLSL